MNRTLIGVIVVIVLLIAGWLLIAKKPAPVTSDSTSQNPPAQSGTDALSTVAKEVTVTYTAQGFSPKEVTVPVGSKVTFVNQTSDRMWVATAMHPDHKVYDGTAVAEHCAAAYNGPAPFDQCLASNSYSFTFTKAGTWAYHNHADASDFGSVTVTP